MGMRNPWDLEFFLYVTKKPAVKAFCRLINFPRIILIKISTRPKIEPSNFTLKNLDFAKYSIKILKNSFQNYFGSGHKKSCESVKFFERF